MNFEAVSCPLCRSEEALPLLQISSRRMVRCQGCDLIYRNTRPTAKDTGPTFGGVTIDLAGEERAGGRRSHHFRRILDAFPERPGRLLDIACGYRFFLKMAQEMDWEAVGVYLDPKSIAYAKERLRVDALLGDIKDLRFPNGSFDLVTLWNVLDHNPDPLPFLLDIRSVLKEDGYVFIRTPNAVWQYLSFRLTKFLRHLGWDKVFDDRPYSTFIFYQTNFSAPTLRLLFNHSGFIPLGIKNSPPIPGDPYLGLGPVGELLMTLAKRVIHAAAQGLAFLSGDRCLIGPSLEAWGRRAENP